MPLSQEGTKEVVRICFWWTNTWNTCRMAMGRMVDHWQTKMVVLELFYDIRCTKEFVTETSTVGNECLKRRHLLHKVHDTIQPGLHICSITNVVTQFSNSSCGRGILHLKIIVKCFEILVTPSTNTKCLIILVYILVYIMQYFQLFKHHVMLKFLFSNLMQYLNMFVTLLQMFVMVDIIEALIEQLNIILLLSKCSVIIQHFCDSSDVLYFQVVGYLLVFTTFAAQPLIKALVTRLDGFWRLLVVDIYLVFSFGGTVNVWRGVWNMLNIYFLPGRT